VDRYHSVALLRAISGRRLFIVGLKTCRSAEIEELVRRNSSNAHKSIKIMSSGTGAAKQKDKVLQVHVKRVSSSPALFLARYRVVSDDIVRDETQT